jgi:hypothetical protein
MNNATCVPIEHVRQGLAAVAGAQLKPFALPVDPLQYG